MICNQKGSAAAPRTVDPFSFAQPEADAATAAWRNSMLMFSAPWLAMMAVTRDALEQAGEFRFF